MKPRTINLVGTIDHMDKILSSDEEWAQGNDYYFICKNHKKFFNRMIAETETAPCAKDSLTLFYLLSSLKKFRAAPGKFLLLTDLRPNPQAFRELLSPEEQALIQLAFYLYTGRDIFSIGLLELFNNLEGEYILVAVDALKMRFDINYNYR